MKKFLFILFLLSVTVSLHAFDIYNFWRHSEIADKNSVFADAALAPLSFIDFDFPILPVELRLEYMPPFPLPFSAGVFIKTPNPNFKSFGARIGYHLDLLDSLTDFYFVYSFDFGFLLNDLLIEYNDTPVEIRYYDFRLGVRRFFGSLIGIAVESGYKFESIIFMLSIKLN